MPLMLSEACCLPTMLYSDITHHHITPALLTSDCCMAVVHGVLQAVCSAAPSASLAALTWFLLLHFSLKHCFPTVLSSNTMHHLSTLDSPAGIASGCCAAVAQNALQSSLQHRFKRLLDCVD